MRDHQVGPGGGGQLDGGRGRIHARRDAPDPARILHLQPVDRPVPVAKSVRSQQPLAAADDVGQFRFWHGARKAKKTGAGNAGKSARCNCLQFLEVKTARYGAFSEKKRNLLPASISFD